MIPDDVAAALDDLAYLIEEHDFDVEDVDTSTVILSGSLRFINEFRLCFMEYRGSEIHEYRFQFMNADDELIRRWDTAPHHKVKTAPHHVHTPERIESCNESGLRPFCNA